MMFLGTDGALVVTSPGEAAVPIGWSYQDWFTGTLPPAWIGTPFDQDVVLHAVNVTATFRAEAPNVAATQESRPQFTLWFGTGPAGETPGLVEHAFLPAPLVWMAGDEETVTFEVDLPMGGLAVESGWQIVARLATYFPDHDGQVSLVLGDANVSWSASPYDSREAGAGESMTFTGTLTGGRCMAPLENNGSARSTHAFMVPDDATGIDVLLDRRGGAGAGPDLDMFLRDANGDVVIYAAGSSSPEAIRARLPNLEAAAPGEWTLTVYNCQPQVSMFEATVTVL